MYYFIRSLFAFFSSGVYDHEISHHHTDVCCVVLKDALTQFTFLSSTNFSLLLPPHAVLCFAQQTTHMHMNRGYTTESKIHNKIYDEEFYVLFGVHSKLFNVYQAKRTKQFVPLLEFYLTFSLFFFLYNVLLLLGYTLIYIVMCIYTGEYAPHIITRSVFVVFR